MKEQEERGEWYLARQIAVGILIAAGVIFVGMHVYAYFVAQAAKSVLEEAAQHAQQEMRAQGAAFRARQEAQRDANRAAAARQAAAELERQQMIAQQMQAAADRAKSEQANASARERAWQQFYKPAKKCIDPPDWDTQVECGNAHIKAQREFETRWASGQL